MASSGAETELAARVIGRAQYPDENDSDAYPIVEVYLNTHRDNYVTATASSA
jgi:hypothetical protein